MHVLNQFLFSYFIWLFILFCLYVLRFSIQSMYVYKMFFFFVLLIFVFLFAFWIDMLMILQKEYYPASESNYSTGRFLKG